MKLIDDSLRNNLDEIDIILAQRNPHVLLFVETWVNPKEAPSVKFLSYNGVHVCRKDRRGRVSIYIKT